MGIAAGVTYVGYKFEHTNRQRVRGGWIVRGRVYWTVDPENAAVHGLNPLLTAWNNRGYKIGFLIKEDQEILEVNYGGQLLRPTKGLDMDIRDLIRTHGQPHGFKWRVRGGLGHREPEKILRPNVIIFPVKMRLSGGDAPQMIPVASRHLDGSFAQSVGGLWVLGHRRGRARTRRRRR
jgi:hypothetical protein